tara:strand:- start:3101 stop:5155 length:2055 start_codon:yes stop_codon:yes gene_type:complete
MSKLAKALTAAAGNAGGAEPDPNFNQVSLLLNGDGPDGGQNNTYTDSSVNDLTLSATSDITQGSFNPFGDNWSNLFDGGVGGDNLVLANTGTTIGTGDFTIEGWFYFNGIGAGTVYTILDGRTGADTSNLMWAQEGNGSWSILNGAGGTISSGWTSSTFTEGQWYHIAQTRTGGTSRFFVNGVLTGSPADSSDYNSQQYTIGGRYAPNGSNLTGYLSNFRIVAGTALYTSAFTPPTAPLTNITGTLVLTCQSYGFKDASTNDFAITVNVTPKVTKFSPFAPTASYNASSLGGSAYFPNTTTSSTGHQFSTPATADLDIGSGDFTIECFYYPTSIQNYSRVLQFNETWANINAAGLAYTSPTGGKLSFIAYGIANPVVTTNNDMELFCWYHIAVTRTGNEFAMYLDGVKQTSTYTSSSEIFPTSTPILYVGNGPTSVGGYSPLQGYVANTRVVKGTAVYSTDFTPPTAPVTAVSGTAALINFADAAIPDYSTQNNVNTTGNADISTAVVKYGTGSLAFDGTGDYLDLPVSPTLSFGDADFTIEGWMNVASIDGTYRCIMLIGAPVQVYSRNGTIECYFNDTDNTSSYIVVDLQGPASSITANTWHYFTVVRNGTTFTAYIDGVAGTPITGVTAAVATSAIGASIGLYSVTGQYPFAGYIDDFRITKGLARYTSTFTPPEAALPTF